jgi:dipeptidyl aminopeptidase/acylaminoacyl peptidase
VFVDSRTLMYLASDANGDGPWLHSIDVERRVPHRLSSGLDRYTSLAASADGRRLVVSRARKTATLWRLPLADTPTEMTAVRRIPLTTATGFCPRMGPDYLVYTSQKAAGESVWKAAGDSVTEIWSSPDMRIVGCPAIAPDGARVALAIKQGTASRLYVLNSDGTGAQVIERSLDLQGSPAWAPDGRSITVAANENGVPHLVRVPLDGSARTTLVSQHAIEPAWSPDGKLLLFSGPDVGTAISVGVITADRTAFPMPKLTLTRGGRHLRFLPGRQALVLLRGGIRHKDLWLVDLATGVERQLTSFASDFDVGDFDISPDGREAIVEQLQDQSDIVMIETDRR